MSDRSDVIQKLQELGAQFGYSKSKAHPSSEEYIAGNKDKRQIFDLEKTAEQMDKVKKEIEEAVKSKKIVLFVGTKNEARSAVKRVAESLKMPYVALRFIGGTITNFTEIKKRLRYFKDLEAKISAGKLEGYTKKERLQMQKELEKLEEKFGGIKDLERLPDMLVIVDPKHENIALKEAKDKNIKVIGIASNDNDFTKIDLPIPANDANAKVISFILDYITGINN